MPHPWEERWKLEERLGKGGQGVTHIASCVNDPSVRGVLKYLRNNRDKQARGRMRREVTNLQVLANAGGAVPHVLDDNTESFRDVSAELFVVMDHIPGPTLTEHIEANGHLDIETSIQFAKSLCKTVKLAHSFPILHRDLKPDNIIVRDAAINELIVVDYGLSFNATDEDVTQTNETFRNRFLDLPETNTPSGNRRDPRSDLTAICAILYYCLTGHVPGQLQDATGTLPHMRQGFSLREKHDDERVAYLEEFFTRGFAPNIANRYQTVDETTTRLDDLVRTDKDFDESDPIQLAASLSLQLRAGDRTTQLAEFRKHAQALFAFIQKEANKYNRKLERFQVTNPPFRGVVGFNPPQDTIPDGLDFVDHAPMVVAVQASHHPHQKHRVYAVASRGEQCVLLAADYNHASNADRRRPPIRQSYDWQEVAWFEGNPESIHELVSASYRDWLTSKMKELKAEILGK